MLGGAGYVVLAFRAKGPSKILRRVQSESGLRRAVFSFVVCLLAGHSICYAQQSEGASSGLPADAAQTDTDSQAIARRMAELIELIPQDRAAITCDHFRRVAAFRAYQLAEQRLVLEESQGLSGGRATERSEMLESIRQLEEQVAQSSTQARECGSQ